MTEIKIEYRVKCNNDSEQEELLQFLSDNKFKYLFYFIDPITLKYPGNIFDIYKDKPIGIYKSDEVNCMNIILSVDEFKKIIKTEEQKNMNEEIVEYRVKCNNDSEQEELLQFLSCHQFKCSSFLPEQIMPCNAPGRVFVLYKDKSIVLYKADQMALKNILLSVNEFKEKYIKDKYINGEIPPLYIPVEFRVQCNSECEQEELLTFLKNNQYIITPIPWCIPGNIFILYKDKSIAAYRRDYIEYYSDNRYYNKVFSVKDFIKEYAGPEINVKYTVCIKPLNKIEYITVTNKELKNQDNMTENPIKYKVQCGSEISAAELMKFLIDNKFKNIPNFKWAHNDIYAHVFVLTKNEVITVFSRGNEFKCSDYKISNKANLLTVDDFKKIYKVEEEEKNIKITLSKAKEIYPTASKVMKKLLESTFPELNTEKYPKTHNELQKILLENEIPIAYIKNDSSIYKTKIDEVSDDNKNIFLTEESAREGLVFLELLALRDYYNNVDKFKPNWDNKEEKKYCIGYNNHFNKKLSCYTSNTIHCNLAFKTKETRDLFIYNFAELIKKCKNLI